MANVIVKKATTRNLLRSIHYPVLTINLMKCHLLGEDDESGLHISLGYNIGTAFQRAVLARDSSKAQTMRLDVSYGSW